MSRLRTFLDSLDESGDVRVSDREQMLLVGVLVWVINGGAIFIAGFVLPSLAPEGVWFYRIAFCLMAAVAAWSMLTWMRDLDDRHLKLMVNFWCAVSVIPPLLLMLGNPLSIAALYISLLVPATYAAQYFTGGWAVFQVTLVTAAATAPVIVHYDDITNDHMVSRVAAFLSILWAVVATVWMLRNNRSKAVREAEEYALSDPLTGLANLRAFQQRADELLGEVNSRRGRPTGILLIDLDDFKSANTLYGHAGGDHLLSVVGAALRRVASRSHLVTRIGGDEFAVLLEDVRPGDVEPLADRYRSAVRSANDVAGLPGVQIDASIGSAISGQDGYEIETLMAAADESMYRTKKDHHSERSHAAVPVVDRVQATWVATGERRETGEGHESSRPQNAIFASGAWVLGVSIGLFSLAMPDADHTHLTAAVGGLLLGYVVAAIAYFTAPDVRDWRHTFNDVFTLCSIALIAYLTGGAQSPLWPLVFLLIVYDAWFLGWHQLAFRMFGASAVILMPLTYTPLGELTAANGAALYAGVLTACGLIALVSFNQVNMLGAQRRARLASITDARTGLANRREFEREAEAVFAEHEPSDPLVPAIVMIDLDNFKGVNTEHGHGAGDDLLELIGARLSEVTRSEDCIARIGGDEFAVVIPAVDEPGAQGLARRYVDAVAELTASSDLPAIKRVTASAGYALHGRHGARFDDLIDAADQALMDVKSSRGEGQHGGGFVVEAPLVAQTA